MRRIGIFLSILILFSCKLFESKDTTDPTVNLTIEGGNEISREVTFYLDIQDDSKIDYVDIIIDDTTATTVTANFDTIRFDVTPFADESDHQLYAKVADTEGNIGESEKIDVVITEFPGWRKYLDNVDTGWPYAFVVDENGLVWIGSYDNSNGGKVLIFNPNNNESRILTRDNSELIGYYINDIVPIQNSRVWIIEEYHIAEYHYDLDKWIKIIATPPIDGSNRSAPNWCGILNDNKDLYIGTDYQYIMKYNGANFTFIEFPGNGAFEMVYHPEDIIYFFPEHSSYQTYIKNDQLYSFDDVPFGSIYKKFLIIDSQNIVWVEGDLYNGCYKYDGINWHSVKTHDPLDTIYPILGAKDGTVYTEIWGDRWYEDIQETKYSSKGIATYDGVSWTYWETLDSPYKSRVGTYQESNAGFVHRFNPGKSIGEAPNGDIWMVIDDELWRYRPSLGGYP